METKKKVLLVDLDDSRRETRVAMLVKAGYEVDVRADFVEAEALAHEMDHDLIIVALHRSPEEAASYTDRLARKNPGLPILLVTDHGVFVPRGTLSESIETGDPRAFLVQVAVMLTGSTQVKELPLRMDDESSAEA